MLGTPHTTKICCDHPERSPNPHVLFETEVHSSTKLQKCIKLKIVCPKVQAPLSFPVVEVVLTAEGGLHEASQLHQMHLLVARG